MTALAKDPKRRFTSILAFAQALEAAYQGQAPTQFPPSLFSTESTFEPLDDLSGPHVAISAPLPPTVAAPPIRTEPVPSMTRPRIPTPQNASISLPSLPSLPSLQETKPTSRGRFLTRRKLLIGGLLMAGAGIVATGAEVVTQQLIPYLDSLSSIYSGHTGVVSTLAWSPDGKRIVSGDIDGSVQIWTVADRKQQMANILRRSPATPWR